MSAQPPASLSEVICAQSIRRAACTDLGPTSPVVNGLAKATSRIYRKVALIHHDSCNPASPEQRVSIVPAERHRADWDRERTVIVGLDGLSNGDLWLFESEGEVWRTRLG